MTSRTRFGKSSATQRVVVLGSASTAARISLRTWRPRWSSAGVKAGDLVRAAAPVVGGGGGGRDTLAQAGGKDPEKLEEALATARAEIEKVLA